jgi:1,4-alpha-glucan branching enzyme
MSAEILHDFSLLSDSDLYLFNQGTHYRLYEKLGAHPFRHKDRSGFHFAVWAPDAKCVFVMGRFNDWNKSSHPLHRRGGSGIWEGFVPDLPLGAAYKYHINSHHRDYRVDKADPFGIRQEVPPQTASLTWQLDYTWGDKAWMETRGARNSLSAPQSIYEIHLGSWRRMPEQNNRPLTYREMAPLLADYVKEMGFTHVELLPLMEHPFYGSWGYQITGFFAPTARYGTPQDFMFLVDTLHQNGIGVILDWVPSHFPSDEHGLSYFDGSHLFEHADRRQGFQPDWGSSVFNYGRHEVRSVLISNAFYWLDKYHVDGLRVDAVASMLYLDYSRKAGEWVPNRFGGRENLEAITFLRQMNEAIYRHHPDVQTIAEESTAWPMVSRPLYVGGLGFGMKWDMGWMHDTLKYMSLDPIHRKYHHNQVTFRMMYAFTENFVLPLSHDEVVHGKGSLLAKMAGDAWQKFANLRLLFGYMFAQPAKKMIFMGGEFGQWQEWAHERSLDWHLLEDPRHAGLKRWVSDLNRLYRSEPALSEGDFDATVFHWIDANDSEQSILSCFRTPRAGDEALLFVGNFTPVQHYDYRIGVPGEGRWQEMLNSNALDYGGNGIGNAGGMEADPIPCHGRPWSLNLTLPPLAAVIFKGQVAREHA